jgi:hypothetical protein
VEPVKSLAQKCLAFSGLFEAELLIELMLRHWQHPLAGDRAFREQLVEGAAEALRVSIAGQVLIEDIPPEKMNFVAAVWYVEWSALQSGAEDADDKRQSWLESIRRAIPSCFCSPDELT